MRHVAVIGAGNVALDVARILAKTGDEFAGSDIAAHPLDALGGHAIERITILSRRGPHAIAMTPKELGELGHLARAAARVDPADLPPTEADAALEPGLRKSVALLRGFAKPRVAKPSRLSRLAGDRARRNRRRPHGLAAREVHLGGGDAGGAVRLTPGRRGGGIGLQPGHAPVMAPRPAAGGHLGPGPHSVGE